MNAIMRYNRFVGKCRQYGFTKEAADDLYMEKEAMTPIEPAIVGLGLGALSSGGARMLGAGHDGTVAAGAASGGILGAVLAKAYARDVIAMCAKSRFRRLKALGALVAPAVAAGTGMGYAIAPRDKQSAGWRPTWRDRLTEFFSPAVQR